MEEEKKRFCSTVMISENIVRRDAVSVCDFIYLMYRKWEGNVSSDGFVMKPQESFVKGGTQKVVVNSKTESRDG